MRVWAVFVLVTACGDNAAPVIDASTHHEVVALPAQLNHELDLLFVLGNDADDQASFRSAVPSLIAAISTAGTPDLHLATITSDLGTSTVNGIGPSIGSGPGHCAGTGDDGAFFMNRFTTDPAMLRDLLVVGPNGCAFVQPLAAIREAFVKPANAGFRRAEAALGIIVLVDQDDCSALDPSLFDPDASSLGALSHFRCVQFGLTCAESDLTTPGPRTSCAPKTDSTLIEDPANFIAPLRAQQRDPRRLSFNAVVAPNNVEVVLRQSTENSVPMPALDHACRWPTPFGDRTAEEAVRLTWFANQLGDRSGVVSICDDDLSSAAAAIGNNLRRAMGDPCIEAEVALASCTAVDQLGATETPLPRCESNESNCWDVVIDPQVCPSAAHQKLVVRRASDAPEGTYTLLRCG